MTFDIGAIPPNNRSKQAIAAHLELYNRTQDVVRVHNPTDNDFIVYNDRRFANERYVIPSKDKDIGYGKGNNDVPQFIAVRYLDKMGMELISVMIKEDWDKKKGKFRLEEQGVMEERLALRSNDPKLWDKVTPLLWKGIIKRFQGDLIEEPEAKTPHREYGSMAEESLARLKMDDADMGVAHSEVDNEPDNDKKSTFAESIT